MLRPFADADLADVLEAWHAASVQVHPFLDEAFLAAERQNIAERWLPLSETTVAIDDDHRVIGFVSMSGDEVGGLFVRPDRQGSGIGRALMDHVVASRDAVELEVFEANAVGRAFYDAYGFRRVGRSVHEETGRPLLRLRFGA